MTTTTLTSRDFNRHARKAKQAAEHGPVIITKRGRPAHVLLSFAEYRRLTGHRANMADLLAMPSAKAIDFSELHRGEQVRAADLG